jgi:hypothetical protein
MWRSYLGWLLGMFVGTTNLLWRLINLRGSFLSPRPNAAKRKGGIVGTGYYKNRPGIPKNEGMILAWTS